MNHERQRIAIAEKIGAYRECRIIPGQHGDHDMPVGKPQLIDGTYAEEEDVVENFTNDLNAMHEAEEWLRGKQIPDMGGYPSGDAWRWYQNYLLAECPDLEVFHATAEQRARAFLKLWKLWEETPASLDSENDKSDSR